jgi:hypothetical protein
MRRPRNPFAPITVPAGPKGDAVIDAMCRFYGISREEAERRGRESMRNCPQLGRVIPMPFRPFTPALLFMDHLGNFDRESWEAAKAQAQANYLVTLQESYDRLKARGEVDDEVEEAYRAEFARARGE